VFPESAGLITRRAEFHGLARGYLPACSHIVPFRGHLVCESRPQSLCPFQNAYVDLSDNPSPTLVRKWVLSCKQRTKPLYFEAMQGGDNAAYGSLLNRMTTGIGGFACRSHIITRVVRKIRGFFSNSTGFSLFTKSEEATKLRVKEASLCSNGPWSSRPVGEGRGLFRMAGGRDTLNRSLEQRGES
jgi:hypothetical protein